jgi:hypothetical protein
MWAELNEKGVWQGEICNRKKNGDIYVEWLTIIEINEPYSDDVLYAAILVILPSVRMQKRKSFGSLILTN